MKSLCLGAKDRLIAWHVQREKQKNSHVEMVDTASFARIAAILVEDLERSLHLQQRKILYHKIPRTLMTTYTHENIM